ncbi:MAG: hypothetical protein GY734_27685 [Herbaspirillum sp.]|uniref:transcriptional regulator domain-containing protein n=1 Tax=Herbaspirillum sp. TaxID=1890675 RepID=UPI002585DAE5|nr:hypothetical protein [Herbaspirillum sp.]MCP3657587.1 hypothetical protein [Herbaspirillum sp.]MCP3949759.1 hypothetical protein [Herbaspirillum sp.]MCP4035010.1 hypothetical protein [Herbaspirillum sp.]MCP4556489.1 hypothetical protein [Herbaspirillum sp.]
MTTMTSPFTADWRNPGAYPPLECKDYKRLAWEFIRRNKEYANDVELLLRLKEGEFENGFKRNSTSGLDGINCDPPAAAGETAAEYYKRVKSENKFVKIPKPQLIFSARWLLLNLVSPDTSYSNDSLVFIQNAVKTRANFGTSTKLYHLAIRPKQIALLFNLELSFDKQLKEAKARFDGAREEISKVSRTDNQSAPRPKLVNKRIKGIEKAHYWLRCYDALINSESSAITQREVGEYLEREHLSKHEIGRRYGRDSVSINFSATDVRTYYEAAKSYIEDEKFIFLYFEDNFS